MKIKYSFLPLAFALAALALQVTGQGPAAAPGGQGGARGGGARGAGAGGGAPRGGGQARGGGGGRGGASTAPAPRLPNGKPDLSGHWNNPYTANMAANSVDPETRVRLTFERQGEAFPNAPKSGGSNNAKTFDLPYTEWGLKQWLDYDPVKNGDYTGSCLPFGMSRSINAPRGMQIVQNNDSIALLFEQNTWFHWIPTNDVFKWPTDMPPSWTGISTGHWEGDTLVIETVNFNGYTKLDTTGHPHSKALKLINKLLRTDANTIQHTVIVHDPKTYTKDWMNVRTWTLEDPTKTFIMEYACEENNYGVEDGSITRWKKPEDID